MKILFLGATRTTTGSMYLLEVNGQKILLECGLFQGKRGESIIRNKNFSFAPSDLYCVILSHAHIDHSGNLPNLCKQGFRGNIYCTFATRDLASIMLEDSAHIQKADAEFVSKKHAKKGLPPVDPLYNVEDAEQAVQQFVSLNYDRPMPIAEGVTLIFKDAGHILGSAQVVLDIKENGKAFRFLFSGDVGRGKDDILRDPVAVEDVDVLMVESTYGGREHGPKSVAHELVETYVKETISKGGKVIIPSFSVGRTQEIVYTLHRLTEAGRIPKIPIFVDSPLSVNATEIYRLHPECFNSEIYRFLREVKNPFGMDNLTYIREQAHSLKLNDLKEPAIIISASGMCEAGRIRHHLKNNIGDPKNLVLFIGYCAENTLGAQLVAGKKTVNIFGEPHEVRAKVLSIDAYSGHADKNELLNYVKAISGPMKKIFVIHGEQDQTLAFCDLLSTAKPDSQIIPPIPGELHTCS